MGRRLVQLFVVRFSGTLKKLLLALALLLAFLVAFVAHAMHADQQRLRAATNPCEHECLLDSGGVDDCRKPCAHHPTTYGPATPAPGR